VIIVAVNNRWRSEEWEERERRQRMHRTLHPPEKHDACKPLHGESVTFSHSVTVMTVQMVLSRFVPFFFIRVLKKKTPQHQQNNKIKNALTTLTTLTTQYSQKVIVN
jgi:hypothetical protein